MSVQLRRFTSHLEICLNMLEYDFYLGLLNLKLPIENKGKRSFLLDIYYGKHLPEKLLQ